MPHDATALPVDREDLDALLETIQREYPALARHDFTIRRGLESNDGRHLEYYPPWEGHNPVPGQHTVEILNPNLHGEALKQLVTGDMLHALGAVDPRSGQPVDPHWQAMKGVLKDSLSPRQQTVERAVYDDQVKRGREHRPFDDYLRDVRLDGYIRAGLFPQVNPAWHGAGGAAFTDEQRALFERMREHLQNPATPDPREGARRTLEGLTGPAYYGSGGRAEPASTSSDVFPATIEQGDVNYGRAGSGWPRPFERETPGETRTRQEALDQIERTPPTTPSIAPTAAALAALQQAA